MLKKVYLIPLIFFIMLAVFLARGLRLNPRDIPSALINKPVPSFSVSRLNHPDEQLTNKIFLGHFSLLHVWATWCSTCVAEHPVIMDLARVAQIPIYALDYKDNRASSVKFLQEYGNPYQAVGFDDTGKISIDWGVYGTPETFLVDEKGFIRYKVTGPITPRIWEDKIMPLIKTYS